MKWFLIAILVLSIPIIITMIHAAALARQPSLKCSASCRECGGEMRVFSDAEETAVVCMSGCMARIWRTGEDGLEFMEWTSDKGPAPEIVLKATGGKP